MNSQHDPTPNSHALRRVDHSRQVPSTTQRSTASSQTSAPAQVSPKFLWWVFARSWKVVIPTGLVLSAIAVAALLYSYEPLYNATAILKIEDRSRGLVFSGAQIGGGNGRFVRTQIETLRSLPVMHSVLADKKVGAAKHLSEVGDRAQAIRKRLGVRSIGGSELYEVRYTAPSPFEAKDVIAAVIEEYFVKMKGQDASKQQNVLKLLMNLRDEHERKLSKMRNEIIELAKTVTGRDPFSGRISDPDRALNPLASLHGTLAKKQVETEVLTAELLAIEEASNSSSSSIDEDGLIEMRVNQHKQVAALVAQIENLEAAQQSLESTYVNPEQDSPDYAVVKDRLAEASAQLAETKDFVRSELVKAGERKRIADAKSATASRQEKLTRLKYEQAALQRQYDAELDKLAEAGGESAELEILKAEMKRETRVYEMIEMRILTLETEAQTPPKISLFQEPNAPKTPIESAPWKKLIMACGAAMVLPFGLAVLREASLRRVMDAEQLYGDTQLRVLGEIASFPTRRVAANPRQLPRSLRREMYAFAESIDALRLSLTHMSANREGAKVFALTSGVSGEGKTSVSVALAMSFANVTGTRTLLIDGDLRDPGVQELIDLKYTPGLAEVLAGKCKVNEAIQQAPGVEGLFVIRAGECEKSPHALVRPGRLGELMSFLRENFDVIVMDTPPVLGASEALSLSAAADATAVCTLRGASRVRQVRLAIDKLDTAGAEVVGSVLSGIPTQGYGYAYAYGYGFRDNPREQIEVPQAS